MVVLARSNVENPAFIGMVRALNQELAGRDGADHPLARYNAITELKHTVLAYEGGRAIACGAITERGNGVVEIKRMYVAPVARGRRIGERILLELESWARQLGNNQCVLFTGSRQPEAHRLYRRNGYRRIPAYGKLAEIPDCRCFAKDL